MHYLYCLNELFGVSLSPTVVVSNGMYKHHTCTNGEQQNTAPMVCRMCMDSEQATWYVQALHVQTMNDKMQAQWGVSRISVINNKMWCFNVTCVDMASNMESDEVREEKLLRA